MRMGTFILRVTLSEAGCIITTFVGVGVIDGMGVEVATGTNVGVAGGGKVGVAVGRGVEVGLRVEVATGNTIEASAGAAAMPDCQTAKISRMHGTQRIFNNRPNMRAAYLSLHNVSSI